MSWDTINSAKRLELAEELLSPSKAKPQLQEVIASEGMTERNLVRRLREWLNYYAEFMLMLVPGDLALLTDLLIRSGYNNVANHILKANDCRNEPPLFGVLQDPFDETPLARIRRQFEDRLIEHMEDDQGLVIPSVPPALHSIWSTGSCPPPTFVQTTRSDQNGRHYA